MVTPMENEWDFFFIYFSLLFDGWEDYLKIHRQCCLEPLNEHIIELKLPFSEITDFSIIHFTQKAPAKTSWTFTLISSHGLCGKQTSVKNTLHVYLAVKSLGIRFQLNQIFNMQR